MRCRPARTPFLRLIVPFLVIVSLPPGARAQEPTRPLPLSSLDLSRMRQGWGEPRIDRAVTGRPLAIGGRRFERGVGTHAGSVLHVDLDGKTRAFTALVGVDDGAGTRGTVSFQIYADGQKVFDSGPMRGGQPARAVQVDLGGVRSLALIVSGLDDGVDFDHANWAEAEFEVAGDSPRAVDAPGEERVILTPRPGPEPRINGPRVLGARPGHPLIYRIPCTGERPIAFSVEGLPDSLDLDPKLGIISGRAPRKHGEHAMTLRAASSRGETSRPFRLVIGDTLALTPPMGWNSWYIHYQRVTDEDMRAAADAMIESGMADHGYMYVNIDDCWMKKRGDEPCRDSDGAVLPNAKFPDMSALCDYIHEKGLRAGLYTSPGPWTCAGYVGAHRHEEIDARRFAEWGFDFLKYDWCSYGGVATGEGRERLMKPYEQMGRILAKLDRDLVYNLCQYGMGNVWEWGGEVGGNCWRTTGDLGLERGARLPGFYHIGLRNAEHHEFARPGEWNDPDYILIGWVGNAHRQGEGQPTPLTPGEQYAYMSLWSLMAAPLIFSGDMTKLDDFTINVLCNPEVIEVDQDPLGRQARIVKRTDDTLILAKPMEDGSAAVGLFNLAEIERVISVDWDQIERSGPQSVRDVWRHRDLGVHASGYSARVTRHGVSLLRLWASE